MLPIIRIFNLKIIKILDTSDTYGTNEIFHVPLISSESPIFREPGQYLRFSYRGNVTRYLCV